MIETERQDEGNDWVEVGFVLGIRYCRWKKMVYDPWCRINSAPYILETQRWEIAQKIFLGRGGKNAMVVATLVGGHANLLQRYYG